MGGESGLVACSRSTSRAVAGVGFRVNRCAFASNAYPIDAQAMAGVYLRAMPFQSMLGLWLACILKSIHTRRKT